MSRSNRKDITLIGLRRDIKTYKFFSNLKIREFFPIHKLPRGKAFIGCNLKNMGLKKISNRWVKVKNVSLSVFLKELMDIREKHKKLQNENRKESKLKTVVNKQKHVKKELSEKEVFDEELNVRKKGGAKLGKFRKRNKSGYCKI